MDVLWPNSPNTVYSYSTVQRNIICTRYDNDWGKICIRGCTHKRLLTFVTIWIKIECVINATHCIFSRFGPYLPGVHVIISVAPRRCSLVPLSNKQLSEPMLTQIEKKYSPNFSSDLKKKILQHSNYISLYVFIVIQTWEQVCHE